jgi:sirohydrochlorin cobaltochelatase
MTAAVVLFGHGARDPEWARPMEAVRDAMVQADPGIAVELAYLEFMTPGLGEAVDRLAARGARAITVVPLFLARSGHTKRDLPGLLDAARSAHPRLTIACADPIGEAPEVVQALARYALASAARAPG